MMQTDVEGILRRPRRTRLFLLTRAGPDETLRVIWEYGVVPTAYMWCRIHGYDLAMPNETPFAAGE